MDSPMLNYHKDEFDFSELERTSVYVTCGDKKGFPEYGLVADDESYSYEVGSGFSIHNNGDYSLLAVSGHVISDAIHKDDFKIFVCFCGEEDKGQEAFVHGTIHADIALLVTRCGKSRPCLDISKISELEVGMKLYMSSYSGGLRRITSTYGQLCAKDIKGTLLPNPQAPSFIELWIAADEGSSGAAIVDDSMQLVGMMSCGSLTDIHIANDHASLLDAFNLKAPGDLKYGVHAKRLRVLVQDLTSSMPSTTLLLDRLANILAISQTVVGNEAMVVSPKALPILVDYGYEDDDLSDDDMHSTLPAPLSRK